MSAYGAPRRRAASPDRCTEIVTPSTLSFPASGGQSAFNVSVKGGCPVTPIAADSWLTVATAGSIITVTAAANTSTTPRTSLVHVRASVVVVTQDATTNLVQNGSFDHDISGWTTEFSVGIGTATWADGGGIIVAPPSTPQGAAQITWQQFGTGNPPGAGYQLDQCVPVSGNTHYTAGASAFIPAGQGSGVVTFGIYEYWNTGCAQHGSIAFHGYRNEQTGLPIGQWFAFQPVITWLSDPRAQSVLVVIGAGGSPAPPFTAYFDDVYVRPAP